MERYWSLEQALLQVVGMKLSERIRLFPELYTKLGDNRYAYVCRMCR